jgi:two-component system, chemotaxis family, chemotaxis protein CheY
MADRKKRILIVDDANLVRLYYRGILEGISYEIDEAFNGLEALEKLLVAPADLLIVDVNMPQMDGVAFLKALRQGEATINSIPALVMSSESGSQDFAAARSAGANAYLVKPVSREMLAEYALLLCGSSDE